MSIAANAPALPERKKASKKELDSRDHAPVQTPPLAIPGLDEELEHDSPIISVDKHELDRNNLDIAAFNEDPVVILIHRSPEKFSPETTDLISINNVKAEMLFRNGWVQIGYLPRGYEITVKRKYVEALALAKVDYISTRIEDRDTERPRNFADRQTTATCSFTVIEDKNPRGAAWISALLRRR